MVKDGKLQDNIFPGKAVRGMLDNISVPQITAFEVRTPNQPPQKLRLATQTNAELRSI